MVAPLAPDADDLLGLDDEQVSSTDIIAAARSRIGIAPLRPIVPYVDPFPVTNRYKLPYGQLDKALTRLDLIIGAAWAPKLTTIVSTTRTFGYHGGFGYDGSLVPDGIIVLTGNGTWYVQRTSAGVVSASALIDRSKIPMAMVVVTSGVITRVEDIRDIGIASAVNGPVAIKQDGSSVQPFCRVLNFVGAVVTAVGTDEASIAVAGTGESGGDPALTPEAAPNTEDDEFSTGALDAKWTWLNQNGSSTAFRKSRLILTSTKSGNPANNDIHPLVQTPPAGNWAIRTLTTDYNREVGLASGLMCRRVATAKILNWGAYVRVANQNWGSVFHASYWTSFTVINTTLINSNTSEFSARRFFFQMRYDGTTLFMDYSPDNVNYINFATVAAATALGGAPDQFGIYGNAPSATTDSINGFDWFRCYHNANLNQ